MERTSQSRLKQIRRLEKRAQAANEDLEKAQRKLSDKKRIVRQRIYDEEKKKTVTRLRFETVEKRQGYSDNRLTRTVGSVSQTAVRKMDNELHGKIQEVEDENLGVKAAHHTEMTAETAVRDLSNTISSIKRSPYRKEEAARNMAERANTRLLLQRSVQEEPDIRKARMARYYQKREIKRRYTNAYRATKNGAQAAVATSTQIAPTALKIAAIERKVAGFAKRHVGVIVTAAAAGMFLYLLISGIFLTGSVLQESGSALVGSTYLSSDTDILSTEERYVELEDDLQEQIDHIQNTYPGYDEYQYQIDEISHDPYVLTSYLNARYGNFKFRQIEAELENLFQQQYRLHIWDDVEIRTRIVEYRYTDPETGEEIIDTYEEEYEVTVLHAQLSNRGLEVVADENLNHNQKIHFQTCKATLGNRSYLFGENIHIGNPSQGGIEYEVPEEALDDAVFAALLAEGEKYLGYAYVWGGSTPETSFDCSGFICWIVNSTGVADVGRTTANGLWNACNTVPSTQASPGDLVFFENTYNTQGASHVGLYVGNGIMLHAGNPIQYTSIETPYWQQHLLGFGRIW